MDVAKLREARESGTVAYLQFMQLYQRFPEKLFCFFEGEDAKYYSISIEHYYGPFVNLRCGGKGEVIRVRELIRIAGCFKDTKKAFFLDQDFDGLLFNEDPEVFETTVHSIENYYISDQVLTRILEREYQMPADDGDLYSTVELYHALKEQFFAGVRLLNGWIYYQRRSRSQNSNQLFLNNIRIRSYFSITLVRIDGKLDLDDLKGIYPNIAHPTEAELALAINEVSVGNPEGVFRGKFNLDFFHAFLTLIRDSEEATRSGVFKVKHNCKMSCSRQNLLSELAAYADRPKELIDFISHYKV